MTTLSENEQKNDINIDGKQCTLENQPVAFEMNDSKSMTTVIQQTSDNDQMHGNVDQQEQSNDLTDETEISKITNEIDSDKALTTITSPSIVTTDEDQQQQQDEATKPTVTNDDDENRSKKSINSKVKYSSMSYPQSPHYIHDNSYEPAPVYYAFPSPTLSVDKPAPLVLLSTQKSSSASTSRDNQTGNSTSVSPQNLPPRLRQASTTENDSNSQVSPTTSITPPSTAPPPPPPLPASAITNGRRHRSILPRGSNNYYSPHPPPLMATPPGVLYTYPPAVHQPGHIAYNIRPPDEYELLALQQQMMNLSAAAAAPLLWTPSGGLPPHGHPFFPAYPIDELPPPAYMYDNSVMAQSANSFLNPEAAEWVPLPHENNLSSANQISIDDEISFPPLNSAKSTIQTTTTTTTINTKDSIDDSSEQTDKSSESASTNDNANDTSTISTDNSHLSSQNNIKTELAPISASSQDDTNEPLSSSSSNKNTPMTYSTITSQITQTNKSTKTNTPNQPQNRPQSTNHAHNQLPPRDRTVKQRTQNASSSSSNFNSRRRQPLNDNHRNSTRNLSTSEINSLPKPQSTAEVSDDWIEVKSKKTKKFDRVLTDHSSEKLILDEQLPKSLSPPLSLTSTGDNTTTTTFTSEDDCDEKDSRDLVIIMNNNTSNDYNHTIVTDIHRRLKNNERLLIIMRGCPGSGKSTLAQSLNHGYHGVVLSTDDYFTDNHFNTYAFDPNRLDEAHAFNRRRASDALKKNITPIIIDNTNTQVWEMKPYVAMGKEAGYEILLVEPQTPWRYKARDLAKRNLHNLPLKRIREMVNRFEHNVTVKSIIDQLPSMTKPNHLALPEQQNQDQDQEILDPVLTPKKFYDIIDDSLILDDVRLCIDDMILFLTSNFFQTTRSSQSSTPLSVSFHDLSLISPSSTSSLPSTPSTPHSRFHRPLTRFPSTTSQDHSFHTEHILRLPTATFSRCIETNNNLTPPLSAQSNISGKKRRKNKNKQSSNELLLNVNNNNNNTNEINDQQEIFSSQNFNVFLPEDCSNFVVIDEANTNDWIDTVNQNFGIQTSSIRDHSSTIPCRQKQLTKPNTYELINIIQTELTKPSHRPSASTKDVSMQCSSDEINSSIDQNDVILIGGLSSSPTESVVTSSIPARLGYKECGIQVDLHDHNMDSLMRIYSDRLSLEHIEHFYEICQSDFQWTCSEIDEYLQNNLLIPTLEQSTSENFNLWNEPINPISDVGSNDDDEMVEEFSEEKTNINLVHSNQISIPCSTINSLEEIYGELPDKSSFSFNTNGIILPFDDELSMSIYQALQRFLIGSNRNMKPVMKNQKRKKNNEDDNNNQKWKSTVDSQSNSDVKTNGVPSLREIINEEHQAAKSARSKQKLQLDYATEHKLKELEHHFPSFDRDLLFDIFHENGYDYDVTFICISTMFDEKALVTPIRRTSPSGPSVRSNPIVQTTIEPVLESYENLRQDALDHVQKRKEFYTKAHQANGHGMSGVASFYIQRASEETRLMEDANRTACERLSQWRLKEFQRTQRLDLHGLHADEALKLVKQIEQEFNEGNRRTTPKSIEIITGYGKNSVYGGSQGKIRSMILTYLQQRNYQYSEPTKGLIILQFTNARN